MQTLTEILSPGFLFHNTVYVSLLVGFACPLVGIYLVLRRLVFMGVALPQISSCGIAFAFALHGWGVLHNLHLDHFEGDEHKLAFVGSTVFTLAAILLLAWLERRGRGMTEGRVGAAYVLAGAWSILLLSNNPIGERGLLELLKGEIIAVSGTELELTAGVFLVVVMFLLLFQKEFLLVSYDREMAVTLKKNVLFWDLLLFLLIGLTISIAVLSVGPLVTFGFLLVPPLIAHRLARNMRQFALLSSLLGGTTALAGFALAYHYDLPVGPTDVALLGAIHLVATIFRAGQRLVSKPAKAGARGN